MYEKNNRAIERKANQILRYTLGVFGIKIERSRSKKEITNIKNDTTMSKNSKVRNLATLTNDQHTNVIRMYESMDKICILLATLDGTTGTENIRENLSKTLLELATGVREAIIQDEGDQTSLELLDENGKPIIKDEKKEAKIITHPASEKKEEKVKNEKPAGQDTKDQKKDATSAPSDSSSVGTKDESKTATKEVEDEAYTKAIADANAAVESDIEQAWRDNKGEIPKTILPQFAKKIVAMYPDGHVVKDPKKSGASFKIVSDMVTRISAELTAYAEEATDKVESKPADIPTDVPTEEKKEEEKVEEKKEIAPEPTKKAQFDDKELDKLADNGTISAEEKPAEEKPVEEKPVEEAPIEEKPVEEKPAEEKPADTPAPEEGTEEKKEEAGDDTYVVPADENTVGKVDTDSLKERLSTSTSLKEADIVLDDFIPFCRDSKNKYEVKGASFKVLKAVRNKTENGVNIFGNNNALDDHLSDYLKKGVEALEKKAS